MAGAANELSTRAMAKSRFSRWDGSGNSFPSIGGAMKPQSLFLKVALAIVVMSLPHPALAQCSVPFEQGKWSNIDPATRGITKIEVTFSCNDQILCGIDANGNQTCSTPSAPFHLHLWGKCSPSDCDWATVDGNDHWVGSTKWIYGYYDHGFAKRYVYVKPSVVHPGDLYLWMYTHFTDPARSDYVFTGWYHK